MIRKEDMIPMLLLACPAFQTRWDEHVAYWNGEAAGEYNDIAECVAFLIDAYRNGQTQCVQAAFDTVERFLIEGDSETKERAAIGFIEDVQNASSWEPFGASAFVPFLKPQSQKTWREVEAMWRGKSSLADVIRA